MEGGLLPGILIVDDNDDDRYTLQLLLENDGYTRITIATGGQEALALLARENFSLILLDMMMPGMAGDEVLKIIKDNPQTRDTPVVVLSADSDSEKISKCIGIGADDYLPKPFNSTILRARVASALRKHSFRALESEYLGKLEQEKRHSEDLLRNMLPPEIVVRLRNGESHIADHFEDATVIITDVVGFSRITERMRVYEIVGCMNRLFSEFDRLAEDVRIEKIRTFGDSYMAVAGLPTPRPGHAALATKLALDMVAAAERLQSSLPTPFRIRVGVHSGPVMAGVIGTRKFVYDVWGDTVNVASRLEAASRPNRVLVSAATAKKLDGAFALDGPHAIETKEQRVLEAFFVVPKVP
jgi:class 3 adenylate cyclase/CheY-like chemotaxis protein